MMYVYSTQNSNLPITFTILCTRWKKYRNTFDDLWYRGCRSLTSREMAESCVYGKQALRDEGRVHDDAFVDLYVQVETYVNTEHFVWTRRPLSRKIDKVLVYLHSYSLIILTIRSYVNIEELYRRVAIPSQNNDTFSLCQWPYVAKYICTNYRR